MGPFKLQSLSLSNPHIREFVLGSAVGLGIKLLSAVSLFLMNIVVARALGAAEAGLFFLGFALVVVVAAVGRLGLDQAVVRFVAASQATHAIGAIHSIYRKSIVWVSISSAGLALLGYCNVEWLVRNVFDQPGFDPVLRSLLIAIPLVALYTMQAHALQGLKQIAKSTLTLNVLVPLTLLILMLAAPVKSADAVASYFNIACLLALATGLYFWIRSVPKVENIDDFPSDQLRMTCTPLWLVAILMQVVQWAPQLMLGAWSSAENVALLAVAQRTAMLISFVLFAVNAIAAPKIAAMHAQGDNAGVQHMAIWSVRLMLLAAVPALVLMLLVPGWLMSFFGDDFKSASTALMILAFGQFVNIATGSVGYLLSMTGHELELRNNAIVSAATGLILGAILIPAYGLLGASIATAVAVASQNLLGVYQVRKHLGFNTLIFWR